jgi:L-methionine (R)-S-oxide reductase
MSDTITINKSQSENEIYNSLLPQIKSLINDKEPMISNLSNISAALKEAFEKISWVGFYLLKDKKLFLGPFQGKVACTIIEFGKGVCGSSAEEKKSIIVDDVDQFPGHIACDSGSRSEIVIPLTKNGVVFGVLDLDSYRLAAFNETDKKYLEILCDHLTQKLPFEKLIL